MTSRRWIILDYIIIIIIIRYKMIFLDLSDHTTGVHLLFQ